MPFTIRTHNTTFSWFESMFCFIGFIFEIVVFQNLTVIQTNIVRCRYCRTYINPYVYMPDNRRWKCNLCYRVNDCNFFLMWIDLFNNNSAGGIHLGSAVSHIRRCLEKAWNAKRYNWIYCAKWIYGMFWILNACLKITCISILLLFKNKSYV